MKLTKYEKDENKLGEWIQRELNKSRISSIVRYIKSQKQRFFNSIILGIYGGEPFWRDITINPSSSSVFTEDISYNYLNKTFGILQLKGNESIFAVDGQHRAIGIREAVKAKPKLASEEVAVIFIPHQTTSEGKIRTRRLFSTLNRYAKPVNKKENNCAS
ncbi:MAG: DNA sulfur modification protein DndB [Owenweeksia sp.]|nr:DNA sulfur modification protein DndB [Owenweeksia sp.]